MGEPVKDNRYYLRERIQAASENLAGLVAITLIAGFLLGVTTNLATEYVVDKSPRWPWLLGSALLTLSLAAIFVWRIYSRGYSTESHVEIVLPFNVAANRAEILEARGYPVTRLMRQSFHEIMNNDENRARFLRDWHQAVEQAERPFQGMARRCVKDLLVYAVLSALREYADQTLTVKRIFSGHRWQTPKLTAHKRPFPEWPKLLSENLCFQDQKKSALQVITIPEGMTLGVRETKDTNGLEKTEVILEVRSGKLAFAVAPHPQKVKSQSREGAILYKYCGASEGTDLWLAKFYIQLSADFSGPRIFSPRFRKDFLPWIEGLFECARNELDWQLCLERDLERMVVELSVQMERLLQVRASREATVVEK